jgi:hypothetical protein
MFTIDIKSLTNQDEFRKCLSDRIGIIPNKTDILNNIDNDEINVNIISKVHEITNCIIDSYGGEDFSSISDNGPADIIRNSTLPMISNELGFSEYSDFIDYILICYDKLFDYSDQLQTILIQHDCHIPIIIQINKITKYMLQSTNLEDFEDNFLRIVDEVLQFDEDCNTLNEDNEYIIAFYDDLLVNNFHIRDDLRLKIIQNLNDYDSVKFSHCLMQSVNKLKEKDVNFHLCFFKYYSDSIYTYLIEFMKDFVKN